MNSSEKQTEQPNEFEAVKARLEEIAREVDDENLSLDDALDLYEEAVKLGLQATNLLEVGIEVEEPDAEPGTNPDAVPDPTPLVPVNEAAPDDARGGATSAPGSPQASNDNVAASANAANQE